MDLSAVKQTSDTLDERPSLLVVSSYNRACGIAQYVEFLEVALRNQQDFRIEIAPLPVDLLRSQSPYARKAAAKEFDRLLRRVQQADVVNIQLEPGLFGYTPRSIWKRLEAIISCAKKIVITYHTVPNSEGSTFKLTRRGAIDYLRDWRGSFVFNRLFKAVRRCPNKFQHIVQTAREAKNFALLGIDPATIQHQPLAFVDKDTRSRSAPAIAKSKLLAQLNLDEVSLVGCFGFLSKYKGIEVAIRAVRLLPNDHHLLIVGGLHPEGILKGKAEQPYIQKLMKEVNLNDSEGEFLNRVHFLGAPDNDEFNQIMLACDAVVLPYAEVGQTSSGPAALALDLQRPLYCSQNKCFNELEKYQRGLISFFQIGNHLELAQKLRLNDGGRPERVRARQQYLEQYSVEDRAQLYFNAASKLTGSI